MHTHMEAERTMADSQFYYLDQNIIFEYGKNGLKQL